MEKNKMKRGLLILLLISFLALPVIGLATTSTIERAPEIPLLTGIDRIVDILFTVLMAVAVLFVMLGAFGFITAGGSAEAVNAARDKILYALIAVVVAFLARGIVMFLEGAFPVTP